MLRQHRSVVATAGASALSQKALRLLALCDGGGSHAANRHVFKEALQALVDILAGIYKTGNKCASDFIKNMRIVFDDCLSR